jgi:ankyrin repeat protein
MRAQDGRTPLHLAADGGHMEAAATLVTLAGADVSAKDCAGFTPLHQAVDKNHVALAKALLDWGAPADATTKVGVRATFAPVLLVRGWRRTARAPWC